MPRVTWTIDGDDRPLRRKLNNLDRLAEKTGSKLEDLAGGGSGIAGGGRSGGLGGDGLLGLGGGLSRVAGIAAIGTAAVAAVGGLAKLGGELETTRIQFGTFLGSVERGNALLDDLSQFANFTPFSNDAVNKAARTLLSFGFQGEEIIPTLRTLGDISAGTGKDLSELGVIFGQIRSTGKLMGQDLLQLINAGFNPLQEISRTTGKSVSALKDDMAAGLITFDDVNNAFKTATSEGGLFFNLTEKLSNSFEGKLSTALGKGRFLLQQIGERILPAVNFVMDIFIGLIDQAAAVNLDPLVDPFREIWELVTGILEPLQGLFNQLFSGLAPLLEDLNTFQVIIDSISLALRATTFPIRAFLTGLNLIIKSGEAIANVFRGVGNIIAGAFSFNPTQIRLGLEQALVEGQKVVAEFRTGFREFLVDDFTKTARILQTFGRTDKGDENDTERDVALATGQATATSPVTPNRTATSRSANRASISGGRGIQNFTINIDNLVENIVFERSEEFSEEQLQLAVQRALTAAVNDVQRQSSQ